jgi:hypothetical protein
MAEKRTIELEIKDNSKTLKQQYKEAVAELQKMVSAYGEMSEQAVDAAKKAAELKDQIEDTNDLMKSFKGEGAFIAMNKAMSAVASGFSAVEGGLALIGVEGEAVQETMLKLQAAMALSQGLEGLEDAGRAFNVLGTKVTDAFSKMSAGSKAFMVTGIGLLIAGVGLLIANFDKLKSAMTAQTAAQKISNQVTLQATTSIAAELNAASKLQKQLKDETLTRNQKNIKVKEFQAAYPGLLKNVNLETMSIAQINSQLEKNIQLLKLQAKQKAIASLREEQYKKQLEAQVKPLTEITTATDDLLSYGNQLLLGGNATLTQIELGNKRRKETIETTNKQINVLDELEKANDKQIEALQKQGSQVGDNNSGVQDFSKNVASFTTATNTNTSAIDKQREALEKLKDLQDRIAQAEDEYLTSLLSQQEQEKKAVREKYEALIIEGDKYNQDTLLLREALDKGLADVDKKYADLATEEKKKNEEAKLAAEKEAIEKANTEFEKGLSNRFQAELLMANEQQKELLNQRKSYQDQLDKLNELYTNGAIASQEEYNLALQNLEEDNQKKTDSIKKKYDDKDIARKNELRQKTLDLTAKSFSALAELAGSFNTKNEKDARKQFQVQKAFNLAAAITNTAMAVTGALTAGGNPIKLATGMQFVEAGIAATVGAANIIKISNSKFGDGANSGGGGNDTNVPTAAPMTANFNTIGSSGINQLAQLQQTPTQAYVVSGEVTSAQALDRNRVQNATL